jgi:hypothetical protein
MSLKKVTITGADDSTDIQELVALSAEFPFAEWGILVSQTSEGRYRFPSRAWIDRFCSAALDHKLQLSTHVCGRWVRRMFTGDLDWMDLPDIIQITQRVQINTHAEPHVSTTGLIRSLSECDSIGIARATPREFIFQWDGVNNHLTFAAHAYGLKCAALFDTSGGAGVLPTDWPMPAREFWCGYAGGLSADNVSEQIKKIESVCDRDYWIDMERRVRTEDDSALDMSKVRQVFQLSQPVVSP